MEIYLKTSMAQRDETTGKISVHHAGDKITVGEDHGRRMIAMDLASAAPVEPKPSRKRKAGN